MPGQSVEAKLCHNYDEFTAAGPGAILWSHPTGGNLYNKCPGCGRQAALTIGGDVHPRWNVAQKEPLTLEPSVNAVGCCGWHGYLRNGVWEPC